MGGLEAVIDKGFQKISGVWSNYLGQVEGYSTPSAYTGNTTTPGVVVAQSRSSGYGPLPGEAAFLHWSTAGVMSSGIIPLGNTVNYVASLGWQGRWQDASGYYCIGAREYNPTDGRFLSPDPLSHSASADLYSYAGGDPINFIDSTGRCTTTSNQIQQVDAGGDSGDSTTTSNRFMGSPNETTYWANLLADAEQSGDTSALMAAIQSRKDFLRGYTAYGQSSPAEYDPMDPNDTPEAMVQAEDSVRQSQERLDSLKETNEFKEDYVDPIVDLAKGLVKAGPLVGGLNGLGTALTAYDFTNGGALVIAGISDNSDGLKSGTDKINEGLLDISATGAKQAAKHILEDYSGEAANETLGSLAEGVSGTTAAAGGLILNQEAKTLNAWINAADSDTDALYSQETSQRIAGEYRILNSVIKRANAISGK